MIDVTNTGSISDIIYSLSVVKDLGESNYYLSDSRSYTFLSKLMESQPYIKSCKMYNGEAVDFNFNDITKLPNYIFRPVIQSCRDLVGLPYKEDLQPWLSIPENYKLKDFTPYAIVNRSLQFYDRNESWIEQIEKVSKGPLPLYFIGLKEEYDSFCRNVAEGIPWLECNNAFDMALLINNASRIYAGPGITLALAQGLGKIAEVELDRHRDITYLLY